MPQQIVDGEAACCDGADCLLSSHYEVSGATLCSEFAFIIDGTLNMNRLRMPFIQAVGITNTGTSFPVAFSFAMSNPSLPLISASKLQTA